MSRPLVGPILSVRKKTEHPAFAHTPRGTPPRVAGLLAHIAAASHRAEATLLRRFPERELTRLLVAGCIELHSVSPRAWRVTAAGRSQLKAEREAKGLRHAS